MTKKRMIRLRSASSFTWRREVIYHRQKTTAREIVMGEQDGRSTIGTPSRARFGKKCAAAQFGLKFNFHNNEHTGLSISFYPQIEFAVPGTAAVEKKLVSPGQTLILPLLVRKEFKYFTFVGNAGVHQPIHDPERDTTGTLGFGLGRAVTRFTAAMAEIRVESSFDFKRDRLVVANFGVMRRLRDNVILYANAGRSVFSDESSGHTYVGIGVKFLIVPKE